MRTLLTLSLVPLILSIAQASETLPLAQLGEGKQAVVKPSAAKTGLTGNSSNYLAKPEPIPTNQARLVVSLPPRAHLFVNGRLMKVTSNPCSYLTPELDRRVTYSYTVQVEVMRGGLPLKDTQQVFFMPGQEIRISFGHLPHHLDSGLPGLEKMTTSREPVLVDFWAPWCNPCKAMEGTLESLAKNYRVVKINMDVHQDLAAKYDISSLPTILVIKDGQIMARHIGITPETTLRTQLQELTRK